MKDEGWKETWKWMESGMKAVDGGWNVRSGNEKGYTFDKFTTKTEREHMRSLCEYIKA